MRTFAGKVLAFAERFDNTVRTFSGRLAQLARAPARHAGGHRFKSRTAHVFALLTDDVNRAFFMPKSGISEVLNCKEVILL